MFLPFETFFKTESAGGLILMACAVIALFWANSPWAETYHRLWTVPFSIGFGIDPLTKPLILWINDGLMAIFFFLVGLEIKREILVGELNSMQQAALPVAAAIGGMVLPAFIFVLFNTSGPASSGWGIPMATDIAFALGILSLLGKRVPIGLKIFLTAVAIVDDMGAVLVIAVFYSAQIIPVYIWLAIGIFFFLLLLGKSGINTPWVYILFGIIMWYAFLKSGVHATIAGVLTALTIPARIPNPQQNFVAEASEYITDYELHHDQNKTILTNKGQQAALAGLTDSCLKAETPLQRIEHALHPWVAFFIMPIFALSNAGVAIGGNILETLTSPLSIGILCGLILGKQLGITLASWLLLRFSSVRLPEGVTMKQIYGVSWLAAIGFTMSIFISGLAFTSPNLIATAKLSILTTSAIAGICGYILLNRFCKS
jgi:NhaA family Na+:H+ antiporter